MPLARIPAGAAPRWPGVHRRALALLLLLGGASAGVPGAEDLSAWLFPSLVPGYLSGAWEEAGPVEGEPGGDPGVPPRFDRLQIDGGVRLRSTATDSLAVSAAYDDLTWAGPAGGAAVGIPRHERQLLLGATATATAGETVVGLHLDVGSAADRLGLDAATAVVDATAFARWPVHRGTGTQGDQWVLLVEEDSNRAYLRGIPIPAVAYLYHPSPDCLVLLGLPVFECAWRPVPTVLLEVDAFTTADADLYVYLSSRWSLSLSYAWYAQPFRDRTGPRRGDQTIVSDMRASAGIAYDATPATTLRLLGGYLFDRTITDGARAAGFGADIHARALPHTPVVALTCDIE